MYPTVVTWIVLVVLAVFIYLAVANDVRLLAFLPFLLAVLRELKNRPQ